MVLLRVWSSNHLSLNSNEPPVSQLEVSRSNPKKTTTPLNFSARFLVRRRSLFDHQFPVGKTFRGGYPCKDVTLSGVPSLNDKKDVSTESPHHGRLLRVDSQ